MSAPVERLLARLEDARRRGDGKWQAKCPAHADRSPSLSIKTSRGGKVLLHCHAGCETKAVLAAVGLTFRDLRPDGDGPAGPWEGRPARPAHDDRKGRQRDWDALHRKALAHPDLFTMNTRLAEALGVRREALGELEVGYRGAWTSPDGKTYPAHSTWPERDAAGRIIGMGKRLADGSKLTVFGSKRGLIIPRGWRERLGPVYLPEGPSDVAALTSAGLAAVGRPSARSGAAVIGYLAELLAGQPSDRGVVVLAERDHKADGSWPGLTGGCHDARALALALGREVRLALPPDEAKDARDWLARTVEGGMAWKAAGEAFARGVVDAPGGGRAELSCSGAPSLGQPLQDNSALEGPPAPPPTEEEDDLRGLLGMGRCPPASACRRVPGVGLYHRPDPDHRRLARTVCGRWSCCVCRQRLAHRWALHLAACARAALEGKPPPAVVLAEGEAPPDPRPLWTLAVDEAGRKAAQTAVAKLVRRCGADYARIDARGERRYLIACAEKPLPDAEALPLAAGLAAACRALGCWLGQVGRGLFLRAGGRWRPVTTSARWRLPAREKSDWGRCFTLHCYDLPPVLAVFARFGVCPARIQKDAGDFAWRIDWRVPSGWSTDDLEDFEDALAEARDGQQPDGPPLAEGEVPF
jgi:hypothetical protein